MPTLTMLRMAPAGVSLPLAGPDPPREVRHPAEHLVHLRGHVGAVHHQRAARRQPQRGVQHGPVLRGVDLLAAQHRVPAGLQAGLAGQAEQEPEGLVGDPVLGVVQVQPGRLGGQPLAPARVRREQVTQVLPADLGVMLLQGLPRRSLAQRDGRHRGRPSWVLGPVGRRARAGTAASPAKPSHPQPQTHQRRGPARAVLSRLFPRPLAIMQAGRQDRPGPRAVPAAAGTPLSRQPHQDWLRSRGTTRAARWPATARAGHRAGVTLRGRRKYAEQFSYPGAMAAE